MRGDSLTPGLTTTHVLENEAMAEHPNITDATKRRRPAAAPYRSDPMPETVMDIMNRIGVLLEARAAERAAVQPFRTRTAVRTANVVDLAAYRRARS